MSPITKMQDGDEKQKKLINHTISGIVAGASSTMLLYPLDLIKTRYQVHQHSKTAYRSIGNAISSILQNGGTKALYRGMSPALYGSTLSWGLYFFFYEHSKSRFVQSSLEKKLSPWQHFLCGLEAGILCVPLTNPIWLIKTRMQVQSTQILSTSKNMVVPYTSVSNAFRRIIMEEGFLSLYKGTIPALFLTTHGAVKFMSYEELKKGYTKYVAQNMEVGGSLVIGALAQAFASTVTYPYQVIKARLQQGGSAAAQYSGTWDCTKMILRHEGVRGYYKGLTANIIKVIPSGSITFAVYEMIHSILVDRH